MSFILRSTISKWSLFDCSLTSKHVIRCLSSNNSIVLSQNSRFHWSPVRFESSLATLRKKTGFAFALCRQALERNDQDLVKAEKWLRAEAAKQGWEKAERVKSRQTGQGLIGICLSSDSKQASMVEVKCETDFVSRNENFIRLVSELAKTLLEKQPTQSSNLNTIEKISIQDETKLQEIAGSRIIESIQKLGENIRFVRGLIFKIGSSPQASSIRLIPYAHAVAGKIESSDPNVLLGKYGTIVAVEKSENQQSPLNSEEEVDHTQISKNIDELGSRLGQHIIGLSPKTVNQDGNEKPDNDAVGDEEPSALLKQKFIFNEEITVEQYLKNSGAQVLDFERFECGENQS